MVFAKDTLSANARGGSELMKEQLAARLDPRLLAETQIFVSRVQEELDETKIRILWNQDLPGDPNANHLKDGGWNKFHKLVFVSNWQMQLFINYYNIPWTKCVVLQNAIEPIPVHQKPTDTIRLGYWSTPHRGLSILAPVFAKLCEKYDNIELDVFSSFNLYGWSERDEQFKELFDFCKEHPKINYHGAVPNEKIREIIPNTHIFAYPSIWMETSCISLMEAMSGGLICVHPNYGVLSETAANWTYMYQWKENMNEHAGSFYGMLDNAIQNCQNEDLKTQLGAQKVYADAFYNWNSRVNQWSSLIISMLDEPRELPKSSGQFFEYKP
jgi:glycosyltransferase involved in cell wall biosynthesis